MPARRSKYAIQNKFLQGLTIAGYLPVYCDGVQAYIDHQIRTLTHDNDHLCAYVGHEIQ